MIKSIVYKKLKKDIEFNEQMVKEYTKKANTAKEIFNEYIKNADLDRVSK